jgi:hypothetical protein
VIEDVSMNSMHFVIFAITMVFEDNFVAKIPQRNGVAERKNQSIMEMARCMLKDIISILGRNSPGNSIFVKSQFNKGGSVRPLMKLG